MPRRLTCSALVLALLACMISVSPSVAQDSAQATATPTTRTGFSGLAVPRFVALKKEKVYGRLGPSFDVDVVVVYRRQGLPVKVIAETRDNAWRRIEDHTGRRVWINRSMLTENKSAVVQATGVLFAKPDQGALPRARLEPGVLARLEKCEQNWCQIKTAGYRGWTARDNLWGSPTINRN